MVANTRSVPFEKIDTDSGSILSASYQNITLQGTQSPTSETGTKDIEVTASGSSVRFKTIIPVTEYLTTYDFGPIGPSYANALQLALSASNVDFGTLTYDSEIDLDCGNLT